MLETVFLERLATGLARNSITTPSKWASKYRVMGGTRPGKWQWKYFPWLKEMHDSQAEVNVGKKAAQMGFTETVLNITFYNIDVNGYDCLYVLPTRTPDASDFSASRFDPALELSDHLSNLFSNVKNVGHKRAGSANLFVRGSKSRSGLKSIPVSLIVLDEIEEFQKDAISLVLERKSGQAHHQVWMISTPSIDDEGIDAQFKLTTQEHFFFKCPGCKKQVELSWPDAFEIVGESQMDPRLKESYHKCPKCQVKLPHETKHEWLKPSAWVPSYPDRVKRGFYINQLYSSTITPADMSEMYFKAQTNPTDEQEFHNSKLGNTHAVKGARLTEDDLNKCRGGYHTGARAGLITMGIDVGSYIHYEIDKWMLPSTFKVNDINMEAECQVIEIGKCTEFEELDAILREFRVVFTVIDANPERRKAREFAIRNYGHVRLCYYGNGVNGRDINISEKDPTLTVDRTSWLDLSLSRFRKQTISLPADTPMEYYDNLRAPVRRYERDKNGNPVGKYLNGNKPDHYAHTRNYAEIALPLAASLGRNVNLNYSM